MYEIKGLKLRFAWARCTGMGLLAAPTRAAELGGKVVTSSPAPASSARALSMPPAT